ncbi:MAG: NADH-quinone oxidoreductase subunit C [bacterium]
MLNEEALKAELENKFPFLKEKVRITRPRRIFTDYLDPAQFHQVFECLYDAMGFKILCTITGLDEGENYGFVYHLAHQDGTVFNLKSSVPKKNPVIKTITGYFPGGAIYERELEDLLGVKVEGLPPGKHYPLPDDWPQGQYPLRKDWKPEMLEEKEATLNA